MENEDAVLGCPGVSELSDDSIENVSGGTGLQASESSRTITKSFWVCIKPGSYSGSSSDQSCVSCGHWRPIRRTDDGYCDA